LSADKINSEYKGMTLIDKVLTVMKDVLAVIVRFVSIEKKEVRTRVYVAKEKTV
jgi:hypothetical protein